MTVIPNQSQTQLRQIVEQLEALHAEKKDIADAIADKMAEAKASGFDPKILRMVIKLRRQDRSDIQEEAALVATYMAALEGTPLGDWALAQPAAMERYQ